MRAAAHAELATLLRDVISQRIGNDEFDARSRGVSAFVAAKRAWLTGVLDRAAGGGLPDLDEALAALHAKAKARLFAEMPDLHARLLALDVAPVLARSVRGGIFDELGWPAFEDAALELAPDGAGVTIHGGLPAVVLASATRLIAIGARGRLATFDLVLPAKHAFHTARYIGGQFLVASWQQNVGRGAWSHTPHDGFPIEGWPNAFPQLADNAVVLADGAWREGTATIRAGEAKKPEGRLAAFDGATAWAVEWTSGVAKLRGSARPASRPRAGPVSRSASSPMAG